ncbi:hypothetical protein MP638_002912 [Amoeboaphelidium occidentale]|nr:hypothetical protein MP638_002912 [Amoeboaphelidium occidentale]
MTAHTIVLIQKNKNKNSKTFSDYETVALAMEGIISIYEAKLQELNPHLPQISYEAKDLHMFLDHLEDICALVFNPQLRAYIPHDKQWIKAKVLNHLRKVAGH